MVVLCEVLCMGNILNSQTSTASSDLPLNVEVIMENNKVINEKI